ncbi:unnamed protein product [Leptosia nina]|uniref:Uncharacterized protein n=1 Tax=Leptosia nina TaxID=320188 RepID=A0AAV1JLN1_9NEOP
MRSAKRTQTYWLAGCRGGRYGGWGAIGPPGHASEEAAGAAAPSLRITRHQFLLLHLQTSPNIPTCTLKFKLLP